MTRRPARNHRGEPVRAAIRQILAQHARSWPEGFGRLPKASAVNAQLPEALRRSEGEIRRHLRLLLVQPRA